MKEKQIKINNRDNVSIAAHEIRNSLSANKWVFDILLKNELGPLTPDQKVFLEKSNSNNERMIELITELVESAKNPEKEIENLKLKPCDIVEIVKDVLLSFEKHAKDKNIQLEFSSPFDATVIAEINLKKIRSAVQEIVHNSVKYTKEGFVRVGVHDLGENISIEVVDSGIGIGEEDQKQIFEKFFRGTNAKEEESTGSGLGLFATKNIAEQHGGNLSFTSELGRGSTFTITIPKKH